MKNTCSTNWKHHHQMNDAECNHETRRAGGG
ncbi:hypothetical protein Asd1617_05397 [Shigella dysenteriae 1617]|uniref:Uncharacterized protein n=1 Tax=Shigella dysenteriae 1617 TaxID=754093 RepID=A0A0A7A2D3_SHIDY|nr:hypothetical protein Asd1617_05397 [Shigella dysenteriae 1617]